jgi:hypothetical protein
MDVVIANDVREDLFADISYNGIGWAEVIYDAASRKFMLTIFQPPGKDNLRFSLAEAQEALDLARRRLVELGYGDLDEHA